MPNHSGITDSQLHVLCIAREYPINRVFLNNTMPYHTVDFLVSTLFVPSI